MGKFFRLAIFAFFAPTALAAAQQEVENEATAVEPAVERVEEDLFRIGGIEFRPSAREIRFDAWINMQEGLLEYAIVREHGKTHESLLATKALPTHLNIALKLLRYPVSGELFTLRGEDGSFTNEFPDVPAEVRRGARVDIRVRWKADGNEKEAALHEWIAHDPTGQAMPPGPWLYTGSFLEGDAFAADGAGDIVAIFNNEAAVFNYPGKDRHDDTVWSVLTRRVPPPETPVTVLITPYSGPTSVTE